MSSGIEQLAADVQAVSANIAAITQTVQEPRARIERSAVTLAHLVQGSAQQDATLAVVVQLRQACGTVDAARTTLERARQLADQYVASLVGGGGGGAGVGGGGAGADDTPAGDTGVVAAPVTEASFGATLLATLDDFSERITDDGVGLVTGIVSFALGAVGAVGQGSLAALGAAAIPLDAFGAVAGLLSAYQGVRQGNYYAAVDGVIGLGLAMTSLYASVPVGLFFSGVAVAISFKKVFDPGWSPSRRLADLRPRRNPQ